MSLSFPFLVEEQVIGGRFIRNIFHYHIPYNDGSFLAVADTAAVEI